MSNFNFSNPFFLGFRIMHFNCVHCDTFNRAVTWGQKLKGKRCAKCGLIHKTIKVHPAPFSNIKTKPALELTTK